MVGWEHSGDLGAAERHFDEARRNADELPHRLEWPDVRRFHGQVLLRHGGTGDRARAGGMRAEAEAAHAGLGMTRHAELTRGIAASL